MAIMTNAERSKRIKATLQEKGWCVRKITFTARWVNIELCVVPTGELAYLEGRALVRQGLVNEYANGETWTDHLGVIREEFAACIRWRESAKKCKKCLAALRSVKGVL